MSEEPVTARSRVLVAVDGSRSSKAALRWALEYTERTGGGLTAVYVWTYPAEFSYGLTPPGEAWHPDTDAQQALDAAVREVVGEQRPPSLETVVCEGHPAQVLVERSAGAEMLVMGSRGHGGFAGMLLGSVSEACVAHAHCPVLIIREK